MTDSMISQLLDFGALGIFAGFLIWQHLGMQKRLDSLIAGFASQIKDIDDGYDQRIERMRERYDVVIGEIREQCKQERESVETQRDKLQEQVSELLVSNEGKMDRVIEKLDLGIADLSKKFDDERRERRERG